MHNARELRTAQSVRTNAIAHFDSIAERPYLAVLGAEDAREQARLGKLLVDAALAVNEGEVFDLGDWLDANACSQAQKRLAVGTLAFVTGSYLRLLDMEFMHPDLGVLPIGVVREVLDAPEGHEHGGVVLTQANVCVQYRRLAL